MELSVVIPFCNEVPQVVFTIQSIIEELEGFCDYEILAIDNMSSEYMKCITNVRLTGEKKRTMTPGDKSLEFPIRQRSFFQNHKGTINTAFFRQKKVRYLQYDDKQGHWNAKNHGIENSTGKFLFFVDAHCIMKRDSLRCMLEFLRNPPEEKIGGVHAYINYMLDSRCLEYRPQRGKMFGYQFCTHQSEEYYDNDVRKLRFPTKPYKVCVMSTCGMMCPREVIDELGGWHSEFGIYCGGEGYMNYKQSTCGWHHWIHPKAWCWHWAEKRGYSWNHPDYVRNEQIAAYTCGGHSALQFCIDGRGGNDAILAIADDVVEKCTAEREFIKSKQVETLDQYWDRWEANPGVWK